MWTIPANSEDQVMMLQFAESGHPIFWGTSPLFSGTLTSKSGAKLSIHHNAEHEVTVVENCQYSTTQSLKQQS